MTAACVGRGRLLRSALNLATEPPLHALFLPRRGQGHAGALPGVPTIPPHKEAPSPYPAAQSPSPPSSPSEGPAFPGKPRGWLLVTLADPAPRHPFMFDQSLPWTIKYILRKELSLLKEESECERIFETGSKVQ